MKDQVQGSLWCSIRVSQAEVILSTSKGSRPRVVVMYSQAPLGEAPWPLLPWPLMSPVIYIARLITMCSSYLVSFENNALRLTPTFFFLQPKQLRVQALVLLTDLRWRGCSFRLRMSNKIHVRRFGHLNIGLDGCLRLLCRLLKYLRVVILD